MTTNNHPAHSPLTTRRLHQMRDILSKAAAQRDGGDIGYAMSDAVKLIDEVLASEPVAWKWRFVASDDVEATEWRLCAIPYAPGSSAHYRTEAIPLCTAPPAPVVPTFDEWLEIRGNKPLGWVKDAMRESYDACRAAMLQTGNHTEQHLDMVDHSGDTNEKVEPVSEPYKSVTQIKPVAELYGITSPTGSETSFTFDAIEARNFIDGGWSCQEYVELERYQEAIAGNSPVTPDGWVKCSDRMPGVGEYVLCLDNGDKYQNCIPDHDDIYTAAYCDRLDSFTTEYWGDYDWMKKCNPTHWAPIPDMPAAPQQDDVATSSNIDKA